MNILFLAIKTNSRQQREIKRDSRGLSHVATHTGDWNSSRFVASLLCPQSLKGLQPAKKTAWPREAQNACRNVSLLPPVDAE